MYALTITDYVNSQTGKAGAMLGLTMPQWGLVGRALHIVHYPSFCIDSLFGTNHLEDTRVKWLQSFQRTDRRKNVKIFLHVAKWRIHSFLLLTKANWMINYVSGADHENTLTLPQLSSLLTILLSLSVQPEKHTGYTEPFTRTETVPKFLDSPPLCISWTLTLSVNNRNAENSCQSCRLSSSSW